MTALAMKKRTVATIVAFVAIGLFFFFVPAIPVAHIVRSHCAEFSGCPLDMFFGYGSLSLALFGVGGAWSVSLGYHIFNSAELIL
jgi:hypothetical protein